MAILRTQLKRHLVDPPSGGTWDVYSNAYWQTDETTLTNTQRDYIKRLFSGEQPTGTADRILATTLFDSGTDRANVTAWSWGSSWTKTYDEDFTSSGFAVSSGLLLPQQCAISVGYRRPQTTFFQNGRSRFFLGPLKIASTAIDGTHDGHGMHLTTAAVDTLHDNALACLTALAGQGFELVVKSGKQATGLSFAVANEIYVDDVIDVNRKRRSYQKYQNKTAI